MRTSEKTKKKWYLTGWGILAIICFWPFIATYYLLKLMAKQGNTKPRAAQARPEGINVKLTVNGEDMDSYVNGMQTIGKNAIYDAKVKSHLTKLVAFYKQYATPFDSDKDPKTTIIRHVHPGASPHMCPYCGVIHEFTASRARKCPDCGKQMIVRSGMFITEQQAEDIDKKIQEYYDKSYVAGQLKQGITEIQDYAMRGNYGRAFLRIAEAYQQCAVIHNVKYEKGFTNWDYSWRILNHEALDYAMLSASNTHHAIGNGYTDVMLARGKHALQQLKYSETPAARNKYARLAIDMFYTYLVDLTATSLTDWQREDAIKWIALAKEYGNVHETHMQEIEAGLARRTATKPSQQLIDGVVREVHDYTFLETDPERLRQMIY
jgi:predicted RNA-binding Zn-ribbon protein involved in translation (DUF1610 family)